MTKTTYLALALGLVACSKKDSTEGAGAGATVSDGPTFTVGKIDIDATNALVPAALKDKIVFEKRAIPIKRGRKTATYTVAAPKGWKQDMDSFGDLKADDKGGFFSSFKVGTNCDGSCEPKDWEKVADKASFQPYLKDATVVKDVKGAGTRMLIATDTSNTKVTHVIYAWWKAGDPRYYTCEATLDPAVADAAPAFDKACSALTVDGAD